MQNTTIRATLVTFSYNEFDYKDKKYTQYTLTLTDDENILIFNIDAKKLPPEPEKYLASLKFKKVILTGETTQFNRNQKTKIESISL